MQRTDRPEITDETPLPLAVAAEIAVARGILHEASAKSLRREAARDRLEIYELFGRQQTTLGDIKRMVKRCRVPPKAPASTTPERTTGGSSGTPATPTSGQAAVLESVKRLKERCRATASAKRETQKLLRNSP